MYTLNENGQCIGSYATIGSISDGVHTFDELYDHRCLLFLMAMNANPTGSWFSEKHSDGESWTGWFLCGVDLPTGRITYHLPDKMLHLARSTGAEELEFGEPWDGHTSEDVLIRITKYLEN